jgi:hypothetical protein
VANRLFEITALVLWMIYSIGLSALLAAEGWEFASSLLFWPAGLLLGFCVPRSLVVAAPLVLALGLGALTYEIACPCRENDIGYFYVWWIVIFALPSSALAAVGVLVRRSLYPTRRPTD